MKKNIAIIIFVAFIIIVNSAISKANNDINFDGFNDFVNQELKNWDVPGVAVAVVKDGKVVFSEGYGYRSLSPKQKVTPETVFPIGSTTKAFTSFAIGQLVDEGKVDLDKPIREYIPAFKMDEDYKSDHVTVRDVLSHRTGLPSHNLFYLHPQFTRDELINKIQYLQTNKELRETWQYSNIMYVVAGHLVEVISGKTWENYVNDNIFIPLNMNDSNFSVEKTSELENFASPYEIRKRKLREVSFETIDVMGPAGSINSNIIDMAEWVKLHLKNPDKLKLNIISEKTLDQLHSPAMLIPSHPSFKENFYDNYALGWVVSSYRGTKVIWHNGSTIGFKAYVSMLPDQNAGIIILSNRNEMLPEIIALNLYDRILFKNKIPWSQRYKNLVLKDRNQRLKAEDINNNEIKDKISHNKIHPLDSYVGEYENKAYGKITVNATGKNLSIIYHKLELPLKHVNYDAFAIHFDAELEGLFPDISLLFLPDEKGNIASISVPFEPEVDNIIFKKTK